MFIVIQIVLIIIKLRMCSGLKKKLYVLIDRLPLVILFILFLVHLFIKLERTEVFLIGILLIVASMVLFVKISIQILINIKR